MWGSGGYISEAESYSNRFRDLGGPSTGLAKCLLSHSPQSLEIEFCLSEEQCIKAKQVWVPVRRGTTASASGRRKRRSSQRRNGRERKLEACRGRGTGGEREGVLEGVLSMVASPLHHAILTRGHLPEATIPALSLHVHFILIFIRHRLLECTYVTFTFRVTYVLFSDSAPELPQPPTSSYIFPALDVCF